MKKIVASLLIRDKKVVNSTNFRAYWPIGSIDQIITRLQEWEIDEITVLNLTHSKNPLDDFHQLFSDTLLGTIHTPIAYGGGITTGSAAESVIAAGCERVVLSANRWTPKKSRAISVNLGDQAILMHLPLVQYGPEFSVSNTGITLQEYLYDTPEDWGGELFLKDRDMDGATSRVDFFKSVSLLTRSLKFPIVVGGGISSLKEVQDLLELSCFNGVVIGNWLNRDELIIPRIKNTMCQAIDLRNLVRYNEC